MLAKRKVALACSKRTHVDVVVVDGIHPNPVAEQGPSGLALGRIHTHQTNFKARKMAKHAAYELVDHGTFAGASGTGDAQNRCLIQGC